MGKIVKDQRKVLNLINAYLFKQDKENSKAVFLGTQRGMQTLSVPIYSIFYIQI